MRRIGLAFFVVLLVGCANLPWCDVIGSDDGIGSVSVSTPVFIPINAAADGDRRLSFKDLRDETKLRADILAPTLHADQVSYSALKAALSAEFAGTQRSSSISKTFDQNASSSQSRDQAYDSSLGAPTSSSKRSTSQSNNSDTQGSSTQSFNSPTEPATAPTAPDLPADVNDALVRLLGSAAPASTLPPDVVATLIAADKMLMVDMEEYYNAEGILSRSPEVEPDYIPYRVHFTVTTEPGWYTRNNAFDAVIELNFGSESEFHVITVTPPETAQAVEQLAASLREFSSALELGGAFEAIAGKAAASAVDAAAKRVEGLRSQTTMVVAYPGPNRVRIRFRPQIVASDKGRDLEPTSRLLTATVLVKRVICNSNLLAVQSNQLLPNEPQPFAVHGQDCQITTRCYFSPTLDENPFSASAPHFWWKKSRLERNAESAVTLHSWVPPYLGQIITPLSISSGRGSYNRSLNCLDATIAAEVDSPRRLLIRNGEQQIQEPASVWISAIEAGGIESPPVEVTPGRSEASFRLPLHGVSATEGGPVHVTLVARLLPATARPPPLRAAPILAAAMPIEPQAPSGLQVPQPPTAPKALDPPPAPAPDPGPKPSDYDISPAAKAKYDSAVSAFSAYKEAQAKYDAAKAAFETNQKLYELKKQQYEAELKVYELRLDNFRANLAAYQTQAAKANDENNKRIDALTSYWIDLESWWTAPASIEWLKYAKSTVTRDVELLPRVAVAPPATPPATGTPGAPTPNPASSGGITISPDQIKISIDGKPK